MTDRRAQIDNSTLSLHCVWSQRVWVFFPSLINDRPCVRIHCETEIRKRGVWLCELCRLLLSQTMHHKLCFTKSVSLSFTHTLNKHVHTVHSKVSSKTYKTIIMHFEYAKTPTSPAVSILPCNGGFYFQQQFYRGNGLLSYARDCSCDAYILVKLLCAGK